MSTLNRWNSPRQVDLRLVRSKDERDTIIAKRLSEMSDLERAAFKLRCDKVSDKLHIRQLGPDGVAELVHELQMFLGIAGGLIRESSRRRDNRPGDLPVCEIFGKEL